MPKQRVDIHGIASDLNVRSDNKPEIESVQPKPVEETAQAVTPTATVSSEAPGRRKRLSTKRENAITLYCTDEMMECLSEIKYNNRVERQRVIQTAVQKFMEMYYDGNLKALNEDGMSAVRAFEKSISLD